MTFPNLAGGSYRSFQFVEALKCACLKDGLACGCETRRGLISPIEFSDGEIVFSQGVFDLFPICEECLSRVTYFWPSLGA